MKFTKITQICAALLLFILLISHTKNVHATPDGWQYNQQVIYVNGQRFEPWGYGYWDGYGNFRLRDIAYILNGTSAQFNIREPHGGHLHFWIERNTPYQPINTELSYFYEEQLEWRALGTFHAYAVEHSPLQSVILSLDGSSTPDTNVIATVLTAFGFPLSEPERLVNLDQVYFDIGELAGLLGFSLEFKDDALHITTGAEYLTENIESQPLEILDLSMRLTGHWVDERFFNSEIINQEVAWPHEFEVGLFGLTYQPQFVDFMFTGTPLAARQPNLWRGNRVFSPFSMESLEDDIITVSVDGHDRKIRVDMSSMPINSLIYYVDGVPHEMVRLDPNRSPGRYQYEALEDGGILLTYIADYQSFWGMPEYIHVYRSNLHGYDGARIFTHTVVDENDRIFFEFADPYAEAGRVYFYTIKAQGMWHNNAITFGGEPQITAYIPYVPDDEITIETDDNEIEVTNDNGAEASESHVPHDNEPDTQPDNGRRVVLIIIAGIFVAIAGIFILIRVLRKTRA